MPRMTLAIQTDANGYFSDQVHYDPPGGFALTVRLSARLLTPFATGLWGELDIEPERGRPAHQKRRFVVWQSEEVQLGSWQLSAGENVIALKGLTRPRRAHARLVLEIAATV